MEPTTSIAVAEPRSAEPPAALAFLPLTVLTAVVLMLADTLVATIRLIDVLIDAGAPRETVLVIPDLLRAYAIDQLNARDGDRTRDEAA